MDGQRGVHLFSLFARLSASVQWGGCKVECRTLALACDKVQEGMDLVEVGEAMFLGKLSVEELTQQLCREKPFCKKKSELLPEVHVVTTSAFDVSLSPSFLPPSLSLARVHT